MKTFTEVIEDLKIYRDITLIREIMPSKLKYFEDYDFMKSFFDGLALIIETNSKFKEGKEAENYKILLEILKNFNENNHEYVYSFLQKISEALNYRINIFHILFVELFYCYSDNANIINQFINNIPQNGFQNLNEFQKILLPYIDLNQDSSDYDYFFAMTLRQIPIKKIDYFLHHHQEKYEGNYREFIENLMIQYDELLLDKTKKKVQCWITDNKKFENPGKILSQWQQVLAFRYIFDSLHVYNKQNQANMARFITCYHPWNLSNVEDKVGLAYKGTGYSLKDLKEVKKIFELIQATDTVKKIEADIHDKTKENEEIEDYI